MFHVLAAITTAWLITVSRPSFFDAEHFVGGALGAFVVCIIFSTLWPQLRFKPQERVLTIDENGFTTHIGTLSGAVKWAEVRAVEDSGDCIIVTGKNNNAMVVPNRAFADPAARGEFFAAAQKWHSEGAAEVL
jgi:hypothetical protein